MKYKFVSFFLLFCALIGAFFSVSSRSYGATEFARNLRMGMSGADVLELQKFLNKSTDTRIATTGSGSPGNETTYFGSLTRNAVIRFQEKYRSEVLAPVGEVNGTGFVGAFTRAKLNSLQNQAITPPPAVPPITQTTPPVSAPTQISATPRIDSLSPVSGLDGTTITIRGTNFASLNTLVTGWGTFYNIPSTDGKTITVTLNSQMTPKRKSLFLPYTYHIYVMANKEVSNEGIFVMEKEPGIVYVSDAEREQIKQDNLKLMNESRASLFNVFVPTAHAATGIPFGGPIIKTQDCDNGFLDTIVDPHQGPIKLMYYYGATLLYKYQQIGIEGPNTVGVYLAPGNCHLSDDPDISAVGWMQIVGTSLPGG